MDQIQTAVAIMPTLRMLHGGTALSSGMYFSPDDPQAPAPILTLHAETWEAQARAALPLPDVIAVCGIGTFVFGKTRAQAEATAHGKTCEPKKATGRLGEKIAIVTGAAQGFGKGIATEMVKEGAYLVIADMNGAGAQAVCDELNQTYGRTVAAAVTVDVTDESSVQTLMQKTVLTFGGLDIFVNNAGIVRAGSLPEMDKKAFELVTSVNYTAYFVCVKYASEVMKRQHAACPNYMMDIIEINSKSGLVGSNKNFAYAGSKFGGIGLTQSFALELVTDNIKVNAVCPGNFLDGPLWSDPEKGLFVQYLHAGKVPGAKTVQDVRRYYESKTPIHRGCQIMDVARAVFYIVEQQYETGQAVPVTGGQQMLK